MQLSAVAHADEFSEIRFRQGEKGFYKTINQSPSIRFPIPVNLDLPAHKVSLIVQSVLGHTDIAWDGSTNIHKAQYSQQTAIIFKYINSLIRCIIDCQIVLGDSVSIHNALMLERSLGAKAWDDSPLQMVQVPGIGNASVRKLINAGIRSIEDLEATDARRIETILGKNPPFGLKIRETLESFPKLRVSLSIQKSSVSVMHMSFCMLLIAREDNKNTRRCQVACQSEHRLYEPEPPREVWQQNDLRLHASRNV